MAVQGFRSSPPTSGRPMESVAMVETAERTRRRVSRTPMIGLVVPDGHPARGGHQMENLSACRGGWLDLARLAGIEPTTLGFGGRYSIH